MPAELRRVHLFGRRFRKELVVLLLASLASLLIVGVGAVVASRSVARGEALRDAELSTERLSRNVVRPLWTEAMSSPAGLEELDRQVQMRVAGGDFDEINIRGADGTILYSTVRKYIGTKPEITPEIRDALAGKKRTVFEEHLGPNGGPSQRDFVDIDIPFTVDGHGPMAFEAFFNYARVNDSARQVLRGLIPLALLPLLILQLIQLPIVFSLFRQLRTHEGNRAQLLEDSLTVSDDERARFAADLHDGPIQDLAGVGYALGAVAPAVPEQYQPLMARVQDALGRSISSLRGLMTDLYPPTLFDGSLSEVVTELSERLRAREVNVTASVGELPDMDEKSLTVLYRTMREVMVNVEKHAEARNVTVSIEPVRNQWSKAADVRMVITDDGIGVAPDQLDRTKSGHLGLRLLRDRVERAGGYLTMEPHAEGGTVVTAVIPAQHPV